MKETDIQKLADLLTDDPDIFNEMAVSTGDVAFGPGGNLPKIEKRPKKTFFGDPVTGQPRSKKKGKSKSKEEGQVLYDEENPKD